MASSAGKITAYPGGFTYSSRSRYARRPKTPGVIPNNNTDNTDETINTRGKTDSFTPRSRRKYWELCRRLDLRDYLGNTDHDPEARGFLLEFTLPDDEVPTIKSFQKQKDAVRAAMFRRFGVSASAICKFELQKETGTLHGHVLLLVPEAHNTAEVTTWFRNLWCRICKDQRPEFREHSTYVQTLHGDPFNLFKYLSKHPITADQSWDYGKIWTTWKKKNLPVTTLATLVIDEDDHWTLQEFIDFLQIHPLMPQTRKISKLAPSWDGFSFDLSQIGEHAIQIFNDYLAHQADTWEPLAPER